MSEPPTKEENLDYTTHFSQNGDTTQPTSEILSTLENLNADTQPVTPRAEDAFPLPPLAPPLQHETPKSEWELLRAQLRSKPHDPDGWRRLVDLAEASGEIEKIKDTFEGLLEIYPNTSSVQIAYLNHFLNPGQFQFAEQLFMGFLKTSPSVDLWKFYLTYVRRVNTGPSTRDNVRKAYEFALVRVGQDKDSGEIWNEYIQFLKSGEASTTWEEQQKMDALRKAYHRAVQIPLDNVETLWQELEAFETNLNKITAKKFMADLSPSYVQARTVLRQLQKHLGPLFPPLPQTSAGRLNLFIPALPTFNPPERALVGAWKNYLKWEESNPLEIEDKDKATFIQRVQGVYRKSLIRMRFYSEIWYMAFVWTNSIGKHAEALSILKAGIEANPKSFLLNFAYAEQQELKKEYEEVHTTFNNFLSVLKLDLEDVEARINSANSSLSSVASGNTTGGGTTLVNNSGNPTMEAGITSKDSSFDTQPDVKPTKSKELAERRTEYGLVWIMYMRFGRRAENLKSSRAIFGRARRERWTPWEVFEAAALLEYHCTKTTDVASRIFEKGLETFGDEIEFVLRYLGFLISVNDENNARALFERIITTFPATEARPLWERWARYEYQYGDLEAAQKLEKRIAEVYPNDPPIKRFAQRHIYLGTDAIAARDLGFAMARQGSGINTSGPATLGRTETQQSLTSSSTNLTNAAPSSNKRPSSPDHRKRDEYKGNGDYPPAPKRFRPMSPPRRERDHDRWDSRARPSSPPPAWEREREREKVPPPRRPEREREEEKPAVLPNVLSWFVKQLPVPSAFDGPVFRTDDLMMLFRNAVIPSTSGTVRARSPPPVPPRSTGRPPPDYGPYQGPTGRPTRRY